MLLLDTFQDLRQQLEPINLGKSFIQFAAVLQVVVLDTFGQSGDVTRRDFHKDNQERR
jgi:hypothetical protein